MKPLPAAPRWQQMDDALRSLLPLSMQERERWMARHFRGDTTLAPELRRLLSRAEQTDNPLDAVMSGACRLGPPAHRSQHAGDMIGQWRLLHPLGEGGMAEVWLGEREHDGVVQRAAVKLMTIGMADPQLRTHFLRERAILARLSDARIARYYDGGISPDGRPWLAMEHVDGKPIDVYCTEHDLDLNARLVLCMDLAAAIAHAHRALIVHRDIKPSNVMVSADGQVKLLDFGIAKQITRLTTDGNATDLTSRVLTPHYASPEQLREDPATTATDVFLLGLLLYEIISGERPFAQYEGDRPTLEHAICEIEPPRPSDVLAQARRHGKPKAISPREVRGDLDAIVLHALQKSPEHRYGSVEAMHQDIMRWQSGLLIQARRTSNLQRCGKWLARHRLLAAGGTAVLALVLAYAVTARMQASALAREAAINNTVRSYLINWFLAASPGRYVGRDPKASEMLADGLAKARRELRNEPALQAEILSVVGEIYMARGEYAQAEPVLRDASKLYAGLPDLDSRHRGSNTLNLASVLHYSGRYAAAEPLFRRALQQEIATYGEDAVQTVVPRWNLADLLQSRGRYGASIIEFEQALRAARATLGKASPATASIKVGLANVYRDIGRQKEAEVLYLQAIASKGGDKDSPTAGTAGPRLAFARLLLEQGRNDEAAAQLEPAFDTFRRIKGSDNPATAYWERYLAELDEARGNLDASASRLVRLTSQMRGQLPPHHLMFGYFALDAGYVALAQGHLDTAQAQFEQAQRIFDDIQPQGHPQRIRAWLGESLVARRRADLTTAQNKLSAARKQAQQQLDRQHPLFAALAAADGSARPADAQDGLDMLRVQRALAADSKP